MESNSEIVQAANAPRFSAMKTDPEEFSFESTYKLKTISDTEICKHCLETVRQLDITGREDLAEDWGTEADLQPWGTVVCDVTYLLSGVTDRRLTCLVCGFLLSTLGIHQRSNIGSGPDRLSIQGYPLGALYFGLDLRSRNQIKTVHHLLGWIFVIQDGAKPVGSWYANEQLEKDGGAAFTYSKDISADLSLIERPNRSITLKDTSMIDHGDQLAKRSAASVSNGSCKRVALKEMRRTRRKTVGRPFKAQVAPNMVDFATLRTWLTCCTIECKHYRRYSGPRLYLVDCESRKIVEAPINSEYVALSYVWGEGSPRPQNLGFPNNLPHRCAKTIEDAILVVKSLGYKYIWIDAFCISPDSHIKHLQISRMDLVYTAAKLTIIAAAGSNSEYGLPGITSSRSSCRQPFLQVKNSEHPNTVHSLISCFPAWKTKTGTSTYLTRGWTYQEQILSRHRLIFTENQVYFECGAVCSRESISLPPDTETFLRKASLMSNREVTNPEVATTVVRGYINQTERLLFFYQDRVIGPFLAHIVEFSSRRLTFETDSLLALQSIMDRFRSDCLLHICGIPFLMGLSTHHTNLSKLGLGVWLNRSGIDILSLLWKWNIGFGLSWSHGADCRATRRRRGFPSWSWAGWEGQVQWDTNEELCGSHRTIYSVVPDDHARELVSAEKWTERSKGLQWPLHLVVRTAYRLSVTFSCHLVKTGCIEWYLETGDACSPVRLQVTDPDADEVLLSSTTKWAFPISKIVSREEDLNFTYLLVISRIEEHAEHLEEDRWVRLGLLKVPTFTPWYRRARKRRARFIIV